MCSHIGLTPQSVNTLGGYRVQGRTESAAQQLMQDSLQLQNAGAQALVLEMVRSFSSAYFPSTWQLALGLFLLLVIRFLPEGLGSLWTHRKAKP